MASIHEQIVDIMRVIADLKRRADTSIRHGVVSDVDAKKQRVRLKIGGTEKEPQKSPWVPYGQIAGKVKLHTPPSVGQQMTAFSPTGDFRQGFAMPLTWSDENKSPSEKPDEHVLTFENVNVTMKKDSLKIIVGDASVEIKKDAVVAKVKDAEIELTANTINLVAQSIHAVGKTFLGVDSKGERAPLPVEVSTDIPSKQTFAKV